MDLPGIDTRASLRPDARKCYVVKNVRSVGVQGFPLWVDGVPVLFDLKRLKRVCVPATFGGNAPVTNLAVACYRASLSKGQDPPASPGPVDVIDELGNRATLAPQGNEQFICLPAEVESPQSQLARSSGAE